LTVLAEQRNPYKGRPPRAWVRVRIVDAAGATQALELRADTGNPCAVIIGTAHLKLMNLIAGLSVNTNFGPLTGG
jgi:hypothetical protein